MADKDSDVFAFMPPPTSRPLENDGSDSISSDDHKESTLLTPDAPPPKTAPSTARTRLAHSFASSGLSPAAAYAAAHKFFTRGSRNNTAATSARDTIAPTTANSKTRFIAETEMQERNGSSGFSELRVHTGTTAISAASDDAMFDEAGSYLHKTDTLDKDGWPNAYSGELQDGADYEEEEDSPYIEVRASVSNVDDPEMPALTFRSMIIGSIFVGLGAGINVFFNLRYPSALLSPTLCQLLAYPCGKMFAACLPTHLFNTPKFIQRYFGGDQYWSFNPGPFNIKEHTVIVIMANVGIALNYGINVGLALSINFAAPKGAGFDFLIMVTSPMIGFGLAGICRSLLVHPASLIWPQPLATCALLNAFHAEVDDGSDGSLTRYRFYLWVTFLSAVWYFLPGYLFTALSAFSWACWIVPQNVVVNQLFGVFSGLGMGMFTFDWAQISYTSSPLITPWWGVANTFAVFVVCFWIVTPALYYTNTWNFAYLPMASNRLFDRFGSKYNISRVLTSELHLNTTAYDDYSPLYLSAAYAVVYAGGFAVATSSIVHTILYYGPAILKIMRNVKAEEDDIHGKLMRKYKEVPLPVYCLTVLVFTALSILMTEIYHTGLPVWGLLLAILITCIYIIPAGLMFATSTLFLPVNLVAEIIPGIIWPGKPIVTLIAKTYTLQTLFSALCFCQSMKVGRYVKISPRICFGVQAAAVFLAALVQTGLKAALVKFVPDLCSEEQSAKLVCPGVEVYYNSGIIWGMLGAPKLFSPGTLYHPLVYWSVIGALLPIPFWLLARRYPNGIWQYVNIPVGLAGAAFIPQANGINYSSWFFTGFVFQYLIRRYKFQWWSKFNYILASGLDTGTIITGLVIFFALQLPKNGSIFIDWWGNTVYEQTADYAGARLKAVPEGGFGLTSWSA